MTNPETFGDRLRKVRKDMGLNQTEFAKKLGFNSNALISRFEKDRKTPLLSTVLKLASLTEVDLHWLLTGQPSPGDKKKIEACKDVIGRLIPYASDRLNFIADQMKTARYRKRVLEQRENPGKRTPEFIGRQAQIIAKLEKAYNKTLSDINYIADTLTKATEPTSI